MSNSEFVKIAHSFLDFFASVNDISCSDVSTHRKAAIVVTPWLYTAVPFYSMAIALLYKQKGIDAVIIWDDLPFINENQYIEQNKVIGYVLNKLSNLLEVIPVSKLPSSQLHEDDHTKIAQLAILNTIWSHQSSVTSNKSSYYANICEASLTQALTKIRFLFECNKFDHFVVPGGVYGTSGLYIMEGKRCSTRVASYDCGPGQLLLSTDGVAAHFMDIPRLYQQRYAALWSNKNMLAGAIAMAQQELSARMEACDDFKFQLISYSSVQPDISLDVLIPLNIEWDSAALGTHQVFETSLDWLVRTITFILDETTANVLVRQHPGERICQSSHHMKNALSSQFGTNPRFRFIGCDEEINTYRLLDKACVILPHTSSIGIEAAALGKNVIVESSSYYSDLSFVTKASSQAEYFSLIKKALCLPHPQVQSKKNEALLSYFFAQIASFIPTNFTPDPVDYPQWATLSLEALAANETVAKIIKSFSEGIPIAVLRYENILQQYQNQHASLKSVELGNAKEESALQKADNHASSKTQTDQYFPDVAFGDHIQILGIRNISIGKGSCVGNNTWLNICVRDEHIRMRIGECVLVGRQNMISTGGYLEIGDYCVFAPRVYISDADHIFANIMQPIIQQGATINRSVIVEENCWLGINTVISGNLTVGRGSIIGANTVVTRDIHPFSVVAGNPGQIIKMYSPRSGSWERTRTEEDIERILEERRMIGMPIREEYQQILRRNAGISRLDPILTGRGNII